MKPIISLVEPENASETARAAAEAHLAKGYRLTNEKRTLKRELCCTMRWRSTPWKI